MLLYLSCFCCYGTSAFFFDAVALHAAAAFAGRALGSIALVSNEEVGSEKETDDLMRICKGRKMRILVAHRDPLSGCGAWCKAAGINSQKVPLPCLHIAHGYTHTHTHTHMY